HARRNGAHQESFDPVVIGEVELRVHAARAVVAIASGHGAALTVDEHRADEGALQNVALDARDGELLARDAEVSCRAAKPACLHLEESDVVASDLARHLRPVIYGNGRSIISESDAAREEELVGLLPAEEEDA